MAEVKRYPSEPLKCWKKAKELRLKYYRDYAEAKQKGGLRWTGGAETLEAIPYAFGDDVHVLTAEPYGASVAFVTEFCHQCGEAVESRGWAHDLCAYMRNYIGSLLLNRYVFGGEFPKPDFILQTGFCCTHGKWFQTVSRLLNVPFFSIDIGVPPFWKEDPSDPAYQHRLQYLVDQMHEAIEWLEKVTGRKCDDERLIEGVYNDSRCTALWAKIAELNQNVPAPLDEKSMYSLYVFCTLDRCRREYVEFYEELYDEVKDRVARGIAALPTERFRLMSDSQPPWAFLKVWRYLEKFGVVSTGSIYTIGLEGVWDVDENWNLKPREDLKSQGVELRTRDDALRALADWHMRRPIYAMFYRAEWKSKLMISYARQWKCNAAMLHLNRGCEGTSLGIMENRKALLDAGIPVLTYEGNMGDDRDFDEPRTMARIDAFMESMGLERLED